MELIRTEYKAEQIDIEIDLNAKQAIIRDPDTGTAYVPFELVHQLHRVISQLMGGNDE